MGFRKAGQNKAVKYELITQNSAYQQQVAIYDALVDSIRRDRRLLADPKTRDNISRAQNLLHAEPTSLFKPSLDRLQHYIGQHPDLSTMRYQDLRKILAHPTSVFDGQKSIISGWHGAEVHHMVPAAQIAIQTSKLPYSQWGDVLNKTAQRVPFSSSAYSGVENRSEPAHNLSHIDLIGRQFYKGDSLDSASILLPNSRNIDLVEQLTDSAAAARQISDIGGIADTEVFLPELAERVSDRLKRNVKPEDFSNTNYSTNGRGRSVAAEMKAATDRELVQDATEAAYGGVLSDGAEEWLSQRGANDVIKSNEERRLERNAKARDRRKNPVIVEPALGLRPDLEQTLKEGGLDPNKLLCILLQ